MTDRADDWRDQAACRGTDPELFFPVGKGAPTKRQEQDAKKVCADCPVLAGCLSWALTKGMDYGVFGGLTANERRALRRNLKQTTGPEVPA